MIDLTDKLVFFLNFQSWYKLPSVKKHGQGLKNENVGKKKADAEIYEYTAFYLKLTAGETSEETQLNN